MASTAETPRARQLGAELRDLRKSANLTMEQLAAQLGRKHSHISRWENGKLIPSEADAGAVLGILGVTGAQRDRLLALLRDAADPNWVAPGVGKQLAMLMDYERDAATITNVEPLIIPGLLQTPDYARSIMIGSGATRGEAEQRVALRMGRRDMLLGRTVDVHALIGEHALRFPPCEPEVMAAQLKALVVWAREPVFTVRVLPLNHRYTPALEGPFVLLEFTRGRPVVQMEHYRSSTTITDPKDVRDYQDAADGLRRDAMSPEASLELIAKIANEMEHTT